MTRRRPPRKVTYFEPVVRPRLARNTIIESTFGVGRRRFRPRRLVNSVTRACGRYTLLF
jgi:hypothetical protein